MRDFVFSNTTKIYFGKGSVRKYLADAVAPYGKKILLVYGGGSIKKNGIYDEVTAALQRAGEEVTELSGVTPNPKAETVAEGRKLIREHGITFILGVGGGSVMDCSKAIAVAAVSPEEDFYGAYWAENRPLDVQPLPLGVIETVTGTGSTVNGEAVITDTRRKMKTSHNWLSCYPKFAILDPTYTFTVSPFQTAAGGFDAFTHVTETYFSSPDDNNLSDLVSEAIMKDILQNLQIAVMHPKDYEARSRIMWDSTAAELGLIKLGKNLDFEAHMIEHQMSAYTDCCHGAGLAVIYPNYCRYLLGAGGGRVPADDAAGVRKFAHFAEMLFDVDSDGLTAGEIALEGIRIMEKWIRKLGLPGSLRELGLTDKSVLPEIAESTVINRGGYHIFTKEEILSLLEECW